MIYILVASCIDLAIGVIAIGVAFVIDIVMV